MKARGHLHAQVCDSTNDNIQDHNEVPEQRRFNDQGSIQSGFYGFSLAGIHRRDDAIRSVRGRN